MSNKNHIPLSAQLAVKPFVRLKNRLHQGFTIIELVLVIVLMGILSVTVVPKMFNTNGFEEYAYQAEVIAVLRNIQLRAMQQTSAYTSDSSFGTECHTVNISEKLLTVGNLDIVDRSCSGLSKNSEDETLNKLTVKIEDGHSLIFSPTMVFTFDSMGRPVGCNTPCEIYMIGNNNLAITIESEGFIHAQ